MVVADADVLIEVLRKNPVALSFIRNEIGPYEILISVITVAEIQQGAANKQELLKINRMLRQFIELPIEVGISNKFVDLFNRYVLSHDCGIPDMLVAATCLHYKLPLLTINQKHFKHIQGLQLVKHAIKPLSGKSFFGLE